MKKKKNFVHSEWVRKNLDVIKSITIEDLENKAWAELLCRVCANLYAPF